VAEESKVLQLVRAGQGLAPFILVSTGAEVDAARKDLLQRHGGKFISLDIKDGGGFVWSEVLGALKDEGLESVMVEGGGHVINSLLKPPENELVDSVIVTIAPTWLGRGGVVVSPERTETSKAAVRLTDVKWCPLGEDVVMCGRISR
jgi:2,5-diamino-6-(ribosylamino)-4(3H)-pyrimidinone 5'-phosphate reductase